MKQNDFADYVLSVTDGIQATERPQVVYDEDGDCIEFLSCGEDYYAERIDSFVTVYYGRESGEVIGCLIKGVHAAISALSEKLPGFRLEIIDGRIRLSLLFTAAIWTSGGEETLAITYRKLREVAEETHAEATLALA